MTSAKRTSDGVVLGSYKYDALGRRVQKVTAEGTRTYVLSGAQVVQEYLGTVLERSYVYGTYVDEVLVQVSGAGVKSYFHTNHLYSTAALTNSAGTVVERYGYDAYGKRVTMDANGTAKSGVAVTTVGFTGRTLDSETGLRYFRSRQYTSDLSLFLSRDIKKYINGFKLYNGYFIPNKLDPFGREQIIVNVHWAWMNSPLIGSPVERWGVDIKATIDPDACSVISHSETLTGINGIVINDQGVGFSASTELKANWKECDRIIDWKWVEKECCDDPTDIGPYSSDPKQPPPPRRKIKCKVREPVTEKGKQCVIEAEITAYFHWAIYTQQLSTYTKTVYEGDCKKKDP